MELGKGQIVALLILLGVFIICLFFLREEALDIVNITSP